MKARMVSFTITPNDPRGNIVLHFPQLWAEQLEVLVFKVFFLARRHNSDILKYKIFSSMALLIFCTQGPATKDD